MVTIIYKKIGLYKHFYSVYDVQQYMTNNGISYHFVDFRKYYEKVKYSWHRYITVIEFS